MVTPTAVGSPRYLDVGSRAIVPRCELVTWSTKRVKPELCRPEKSVRLLLNYHYPQVGCRSLRQLVIEATPIVERAIARMDAMRRRYDEAAALLPRARLSSLTR